MEYRFKELFWSIQGEGGTIALPSVFARRFAGVFIGAVILSSIAGFAGAQSRTFPNKPLRVVVAFVPGGITDIVGRTVARKLEDLGQPVIVDNRGGANGQVGTALVAKAPADGYTLLIASLGTHGAAPSLYQNLPYDPLRDFEHVSMVAVVGNLMVVNPSLPAQNLKELIALAKKSPGKLNYGGVGGSSQLMSELINSMADIKTVHVPYKGAAPATVAVLNGEIDFMLHSFSGLLPLVQAGKLRAIAVTTDKRSPQAPDIPTMSEAGSDRLQREHVVFRRRPGEDAARHGHAPQSGDRQRHEVAGHDRLIQHD